MAGKRIERTGKEEIQGSNDRERLLFIAQNYNGLHEIPESQIARVSGDGGTIITIHGTKVNEALIEQVLREEDARLAAARAVAGVPANAVSKEQMQAMIDEAVKRALASQPPGDAKPQ